MDSYEFFGMPRFMGVRVKSLASLVTLALMVCFAVPASAKSSELIDSVRQVTGATTTSTFRCYDAPFQFPDNGFIGWIWKDPAALPAPPAGDGHLHTGIDVWPFGGQGSPVYPLADGYIRRIGNGKGLDALNLWFPSVNGGTEVYYAHIKVDPKFIPPGNDKALSIEVNIAVKATDVLGTVYGENWIHLSIGSTNGPYSPHNDLDPNQTQDPSPYFQASLNYPTGDREATDSYGNYINKSDVLCNPNRNSFSMRIVPGSTTTITQAIVTPQIPAKPDIILLADTTGSMGDAIANVQANATSVITQVLAVQGDAQFGAAEYKDFNCDANPYLLDQAITADTTAVTTTINTNWVAGGGCDTPEAQLNALSQLATDGATGWRSDATRIVAWFGDEPGHDPSNGYTLDDTIAALTAANIRVIAVNVADLDGCAESCGQATAITQATNGTLLTLGSASTRSGHTGNNSKAAPRTPTTRRSLTSINSSVAEAILAGLQSLPTTVTPQTSGCDPYVTVTFDAPSKTVTSGETATFIATLTAASNIPVGTSITCQINYLLDGKPVVDTPGFATSIFVPPTWTTLPPTTTATLSPVPNAAGWVNSDAAVNLSVADNSGGSGIQSLTYSATGAQSIGSTTVVSNSAVLNITTEGQTTLMYNAADYADNVETAKTLNVKLDKTAPHLAITSPQAQDYSHAETFALAWTSDDALSGIASDSATLDGSTVTNGQVIDASHLSLGDHTLVVIVKDNAGNITTRSVVFQVAAATHTVFLPMVGRIQ